MTTEIQFTDDEKKSLKRILQDIGDQRNKYRMLAELETNAERRCNWWDVFETECSEDYKVLHKLLNNLGLSIEEM